MGEIDIHTISCGAALVHLRIALRQFGYAGAVVPFPDPDDPDLLARIRLGNKRDATAEEHALFDAIGKRRTNRQAFEQRTVPEDVLIALQQAAHYRRDLAPHCARGEQPNQCGRLDSPG